MCKYRIQGTTTFNMFEVRRQMNSKYRPDDLTWANIMTTLLNNGNISSADNDAGRIFTSLAANKYDAFKILFFY